MAVDRNAADPLRLRRNAQRGRDGGFTSGVTVSAPLSNTGSQIQLNLDSAGGLESNSGSLRVKLIDTSFSRTASGVGIALKTNGGLQISTGVGILLNGTTLLLGASGLSINAGGVGSAQLGILTTKGDLVGFSTVHARIPIGADGTVLTADNAQVLGLKWAVPLAATNFVYNEVPAGTQNSVNVTFTLANTPTVGTVRLHRNGLRLKPTTDFSVSGSTITMVVAPAPADVLLADYNK